MFGIYDEGVAFIGTTLLFLLLGCATTTVTLLDYYQYSFELEMIYVLLSLKMMKFRVISRFLFLLSSVHHHINGR